MAVPEYLDTSTQPDLQVLGEIPDAIRDKLCLVGGKRVGVLLGGTPKWRRGKQPDTDLVVSAFVFPQSVAEAIAAENPSFTPKPKFVAWDYVYLLEHEKGEIELINDVEDELTTKSSTVATVGDPPTQVRMAALGPVVYRKIYGDRLFQVAKQMQRGGEFRDYAEAGLSKDFFDVMALVKKFGPDAIVQNLRDAHEKSEVPGAALNIERISAGCNWATRYADDVYALAETAGLEVPDREQYVSAFKSLQGATERALTPQVKPGLDGASTAP